MKTVQLAFKISELVHAFRAQSEITLEQMLELLVKQLTPEEAVRALALLQTQGGTAPETLSSLRDDPSRALALFGAERLPPGIDKYTADVMKRTVFKDRIVCLECGESLRMLKRHLEGTHGLTPAEYRKKHNLSRGYPLVCEEFSQLRSNDMKRRNQEKPDIAANTVARIEETVFKDRIVCLECGESLRTMKRHLRDAHGLTPAEYRKKYNLSRDYPMTCEDTSAIRREKMGHLTARSAKNATQPGEEASDRADGGAGPQRPRKGRQPI